MENTEAKNLGPFASMSQYVRLCSVMFGYVRLCSVMFGYVRLCSVMFGYVRMCVRLSADLSVAVPHVNHGHNAWHAYFTSLDATFANKKISTFLFSQTGIHTSTGK